MQDSEEDGKGGHSVNDTHFIFVSLSPENIPTYFPLSFQRRLHSQHFLKSQNPNATQNLVQRQKNEGQCSPETFCFTAQVCLKWCLKNFELVDIIFKKSDISNENTHTHTHRLANVSGYSGKVGQEATLSADCPGPQGVGWSSSRPFL